MVNKRFTNIHNLTPLRVTFVHSYLLSCMFDQMRKVRGEVSWSEGDRRRASLCVTCNNLLLGPGTPFCFNWNINDDENVIGKWREGSCDYASSAAAVECVANACLLCACYFIALLLLLVPSSDSLHCINSNEKCGLWWSQILLNFML